MRDGRGKVKQQEHGDKQHGLCYFQVESVHHKRYQRDCIVTLTTVKG